MREEQNTQSSIRNEDPSASAAVSTDSKDIKPVNEEPKGSFFKTFLVDVAIAAVLAAIVLSFIRPTIVQQTSMENTLHPYDYMIMYKRAYNHHGPDRGDIIIFQSSLENELTGEEKLLIKRVIGLPGDELSIKGDQLYINGEIYEEDYLKDGITPARDMPAEGESYTVPDGCYFCMGDNRVGSIDSRDSRVGPVSEELIKGKVVLRLFPFTAIQRF